MNSFLGTLTFVSCHAAGKAKGKGGREIGDY